MGKNEAELGEILKLLGKKKQNTAISSVSILSLLVLSACGGGSEDEAGSVTTPVTPTPDPDPVVPVSYSGSVIKGPLENALVFLDYDGDGILGADEPSVRTNSDGSFEVEGNVEGIGFVAQTDSTTVDTSSGEVLDNVVLKAPSGSSVVTPATTIMQEAGITKEEVSAVLGLPEGVDPTSFNPYSADADPETALAVEKVSQQVMTTITAVSSAVEGAGASSAAAFAVALETVVEVVKEKAAVVKENPAAVVEVLDFSKTEEIAAVTEKVSAKIEEQGIATKEDFETVKADLNVAVTNVNTKINEVTDLKSEDSMAAFSVATELKEQVKAAVESKGDPAAAIKFTDAAEIEKVKEEKAEEIKEKIDSGELVTFLDASIMAGTNILNLKLSGHLAGILEKSNFSVRVDGSGVFVDSLSISEDGDEISLELSQVLLNGQTLDYSYSTNVLNNEQSVGEEPFAQIQPSGERFATVIEDNNPPLLKISSDISSVSEGQTALITFNFSEVPTGFDISDITLIDGELSSFSQDKVMPNLYTAIFKPMAKNSGNALVSVEPNSYVDLAGNSGKYASSLSINYDTQPPQKPEIITEFEDSRTTDKTPTLSGTAEPGSIVEIIENGIFLGTTLVNENGFWQFTSNSALTIGVRDFWVRSVDKFGNVSESSDILSVRIDDSDSNKVLDGINGYLRLKYSSINEHENGVYLGDLEWVYPNDLNADVTYSVYHGYDFLKLEGSKLYLNDGYHFEYEANDNALANTFTITKYNPITYNGEVANLSWTGWNTTNAVIKVDETSTNGKEIDVWEQFTLPFDNSVESISFKPLEFKAYENGAIVAELSSTLKTNSFGLTDKTIFEISGTQLKLKDDLYYDPQLFELVNNSNNTFYSISPDDDLGFVSYQTAALDINFVDSIKITNLLQGVQTSTIPYFAGTPVLQKGLSDNPNIDALLSVEDSSPSSVNFWASNKNFSSIDGETIITYSFIPESETHQKFAQNQKEPNPRLDEINTLSASHKESVKLALKEWEKVANIVFEEVHEVDNSAGTIRFGFTNHSKIASDGNPAAAWAVPPSASPQSGDIWLHMESMGDNYVQGKGYGFATLLHEIGHALGLKHPFENTKTLPASLDKSTYTIMSYTDDINVYNGEDYLISSTPMVLDIAAIQYLYGAAPYNEGSTVYSFDNTKPFAKAIWDSGGIDTINLDNFSDGSIVNLQPGKSSTIIFKDWSMVDNLSIASGSLIENIIGTSGDDIIVGNSADNQISGGPGFDTLTGSDGNDVFIFYKSELSNSKFDTIIDFVSGSDKIKLIIDEQAHETPSAQSGQISVINPSSGSELGGLVVSNPGVSNDNSGDKETDTTETGTTKTDTTETGTTKTDTTETETTKTDTTETETTKTDMTEKETPVYDSIIELEIEVETKDTESNKQQAVSFPIATNVSKDAAGNFKLEVGTSNEVLVYLEGGADFNIETDLIIESLFV